MNEKKAGIVTLYASQNFGAFLQSFAMQSVLQRLGYKVQFIKYAGLDIHELIFMVKTKNVKLAFFRVKQYRKYLFSRKLLNIAKRRYRNEHLDLFVVGSDTLWDVQNPTIHATEYYLGKGLNSTRVVAYAPSANGTSVDKFCDVYHEENPFDSFTAIGVRDKNTSDLVEKITGTPPTIVLDPTLLLDKSDYPVKEPTQKEKYILVYGYSFTEEEKRAIQIEANKLKAKTISIGLLNSWCDENVVATVPEFLGYIKNAECIFTGTFHGTIFSMIMEKRFVTYARNNYKVLDLLGKLEMEERNGSPDIKHSSELVEKEIDYEALHRRVLMLRKESREFLKDAVRNIESL